MNVQEKLAVPPNAHRSLYRIPYSETDAMARVYYANYLIWFERGRTECLRAAGFTYRAIEAMGIYLPVRQCHVRYLGFGEYDDEIELFTWISNLGRARVEFTTVAKKNDAAITIGVVELACITTQGKLCAIPEEIATALANFCNHNETP